MCLHKSDGLLDQTNTTGINTSTFPTLPSTQQKSLICCIKQCMQNDLLSLQEQTIAACTRTSLLPPLQLLRVTSSSSICYALIELYLIFGSCSPESRSIHWLPIWPSLLCCAGLFGVCLVAMDPKTHYPQLCTPLAPAPLTDQALLVLSVPSGTNLPQCCNCGPLSSNCPKESSCGLQPPPLLLCPCLAVVTPDSFLWALWSCSSGRPPGTRSGKAQSISLGPDPTWIHFAGPMCQTTRPLTFLALHCPWAHGPVLDSSCFKLKPLTPGFCPWSPPASGPLTLTWLQPLPDSSFTRQPKAETAEVYIQPSALESLTQVRLLSQNTPPGTSHGRHPPLQPQFGPLLKHKTQTVTHQALTILYPNLNPPVSACCKIPLGSSFSAASPAGKSSFSSTEQGLTACSGSRLSFYFPEYLLLLVSCPPTQLLTEPRCSFFSSVSCLLLSAAACTTELLTQQLA